MLRPLTTTSPFNGPIDLGKGPGVGVGVGTVVIAGNTKQPNPVWSHGGQSTESRNLRQPARLLRFCSRHSVTSFLATSMAGKGGLLCLAQTALMRTMLTMVEVPRPTEQSGFIPRKMTRNRS